MIKETAEKMQAIFSGGMSSNEVEKIFLEAHMEATSLEYGVKQAQEWGEGFEWPYLGNSGGRHKTSARNDEATACHTIRQQRKL